MSERGGNAVSAGLERAVGQEEAGLWEGHTPVYEGGDTKKVKMTRVFGLVVGGGRGNHGCGSSVDATEENGWPAG